MTLYFDSYAVIATGCAGCPKIHCGRPGCDTYFCYHCKQYWHPNKTCDAARAERSPNIRSASISYGPDSELQNSKCPWPTNVWTWPNTPKRFQNPGTRDWIESVSYGHPGLVMEAN